MNIVRPFPRPWIDTERYKFWIDTEDYRYRTGRLTYRRALAEAWDLVHGKHDNPVQWFTIFDMGLRSGAVPRAVFFWANTRRTYPNYPARLLKTAALDIPTKPRRAPKDPSC